MKRIAFGCSVLAMAAFSGCQIVETIQFPGPVKPDEPPLPPHPVPEFGTTVSQKDPPPAISGGTLLVTADGKQIVASDPDRDQIYVVTLLPLNSSVVTLPLSPKDEPGRLVETSRKEGNRVHVVLRGGGAVVSIDLATGTIVDRRNVCALPRGIAWDAARDLLVVACAGGELVMLPAAGGAPVSTVKLDRDLRDVVVEGDHIWVSRFRSAEVLLLDKDGKIIRRRAPFSYSNVLVREGAEFSASVAWRMIKMPDGGVRVLHQRAQSGVNPPVSTDTPGGYGAGSKGNDCDSSIVHATMAQFHTGDATDWAGPTLINLAVPVDLALSPAGDRFAFVAAGNARLGKNAVSAFERSILDDPAVPCHDGRSWGLLDPIHGEPTAVAFVSEDLLVVQSRQPATLEFTRVGDFVAPVRAPIVLSDVSREDTGHAIFHSDAGTGLACASCHPEGGDDSHTWNFDPIGQRRTQSLRGGVLQTAPFHWDGSLPDFSSLFKEVMVKRMDGPQLPADQVDALAHWIDRLPALPSASFADPATVERGRVLFNDPVVACASCHGGPRFTNHAKSDVGTGGPFVVPSLTNVAFRAPFMHTGCAPTLRARFGPSDECGRRGIDQHGHTSQLSSAQIDDLVAYLETL